MADQNKTDFQVPPDMRAFAEQSVAQAKKAFDGFMTAAQGAAAAFEGQAAAAQAGAKDMQRKAVQFAEVNVAASFELAQKLVTAKDPSEMARLHAEYVKAQMQKLTEQARELGETVAKAAQAAKKD
jgi:phasin